MSTAMRTGSDHGPVSWRVFDHRPMYCATQPSRLAQCITVAGLRRSDE